MTSHHHHHCIHVHHPITAQLQEIRKASLSKVLCENSDTMGFIQPLALLSPFSELFDGLK